MQTICPGEDRSYIATPGSCRRRALAQDVYACYIVKNKDHEQTKTNMSVVKAKAKQYNNNNNNNNMNNNNNNNIILRTITIIINNNKERGKYYNNHNNSNNNNKK